MGFSDEEFAALPDKLPLRVIRMHVTKPGFRTRCVVVVTTLLDPDLYPADDIRALYAERWNVELIFHQIKTLMSLDILRSMHRQLESLCKCAAESGIALMITPAKTFLSTLREFSTTSPAIIHRQTQGAQQQGQNS